MHESDESLVRLSVSLNYKYYYPGETIIMWYKVDNINGKKPVELLKWRLLRTVECADKRNDLSHRQVETIQKGEQVAYCQARKQYDEEFLIHLPVMASPADISLGNTQCKIEDLMPDKLHPVMTELMDNFPHTTYGVNFRISYEVVLEVCLRDEDNIDKSSITVPVMIVPKQDLVMFSN